MRDDLLRLYNEVWTTDWFPEDWRRYQVMFIDKIGKEKVRPISLSSCVGKVYERMINERLIWWAENGDKINKEQNGFRRGKSCMENLAKIYTDIKCETLEGKYVLVAYLDVSSAYDNVRYSNMIDILKRSKCPGRIIKFFNKWMIYRDVEYIINSRSTIERKAYKGLPQGAVLSLLAYTLYTRDLVNDLEEDIKIVQFADDIAIYTSGMDRIGNKKKLTRAVNTIAKKLSIIGLSLAPKKTELVEYTKAGVHDRNMYMEIGGTRIYNAEGAKFLGIWMDNRLNFARHVNIIRGKMDKANSVLNYLCKKSSGLEVNTALILYKSIVRSRAEYGIPIWYPSDDNLRIKLERGQYAGIRTALGYRNSTPTNIMIAEAKVMYLKDRAGLLGRNFIAKNICYGELGICDNLERLVKKEDYARYRDPRVKRSVLSEAWIATKKIRNKLGTERKFEIFESKYKDITMEVKTDIITGKQKKNVNFSDSELIDRINKRNKIREGATYIYTDGSKKKKGMATGASLVFEGRDIAYNISLPKECCGSVCD